MLPKLSFSPGNWHPGWNTASVVCWIYCCIFHKFAITWKWGWGDSPSETPKNTCICSFSIWDACHKYRGKLPYCWKTIFGHVHGNINSKFVHFTTTPKCLLQSNPKRRLHRHVRERLLSFPKGRPDIEMGLNFSHFGIIMLWKICICCTSNTQKSLTYLPPPARWLCCRYVYGYENKFCNDYLSGT